MAMTGVPVAPGHPPPGGSSASEQRVTPATVSTGPGDRWRDLRPRAGQIVATQVALAAPVAALGRGLPTMLAAAALAGAVLFLAWCRVRRRWLYEWLSISLGYATRRRTVTPDGGPVALLDLVAPDTVRHPVELAGSSAVLLDDPGGVVALLEFGDRADLLGDGGQQLPSPASLLPADPGDGPPVRVQLVLSAVPVTGAGGGGRWRSGRHLVPPADPGPGGRAGTGGAGRPGGAGRRLVGAGVTKHPRQHRTPDRPTRPTAVGTAAG
ncbi:hypothetical protein GCM10009541_25870 [Micromonospora gifhornensis]|uniref:Type VII secretion protein EccE n=1 Tax=Micromonospora gifhornensis TaxID=84594 RepID=A0ABQ4IHY7_9ACTN|nr:hypothetical protein Vgi01_41660 [Micromonospora gifhornensis]